MKAVIIVDHLSINRWQVSALELAHTYGLEPVLILNCTNSHSNRDYLRNLLYYLLRLWIGIRVTAFKSTDISTLSWLKCPIVDFESDWRGTWQKVPAKLHSVITSHHADVVIKFGMNLLADPSEIPVKHGVISYHHGDPSLFRGRPAGFYEILNWLKPGHSHKSMGIIVQKLSNQLDGGNILSSCQSRIIPHSYSKTLKLAYMNSVPLLKKAILALKKGSETTQEIKGPMYRLPTNLMVCRFLFTLLISKLRRLGYGLFF